MKKSFEFVLLPHIYVYTTKISSGIIPLMSFRESKEATFIVKKEEAEENALAFRFPCRCIKLKSPTALSDVGITALVSSQLAKSNISCNVVAAFHHDYFFVPTTHAARAMRVLNDDFLKPKNSVKI